MTTYNTVTYQTTALATNYPGLGIRCNNQDIYCNSEDYYCDGSVAMRKRVSGFGITTVSTDIYTISLAHDCFGGNTFSKVAYS